MRRVVGTKTIPAYEREILEVTCDLGCGRKGTDEGLSEVRWTRDGFEIDDTRLAVTLERKDGHSYPEGSHGTKWSVDICPDCFKTKLVPWLISQGATIHEEDFNW